MKFCPVTIPQAVVRDCRLPESHFALIIVAVTIPQAVVRDCRQGHYKRYRFYAFLVTIPQAVVRDCRQRRSGAAWFLASKPYFWKPSPFFAKILLVGKIFVLKLHNFWPQALINQGPSVSTEKTENLNGRMRSAGMCRRFSVFLSSNLIIKPVEPITGL